MLLPGLVALALGCGSSSSDAQGCQPVPPVAKGAWAVAFVNAGATCATPTHTAGIGSVTATKDEDVVSDAAGTDAGVATVSCSVEARDDASFAVHAEEWDGNDSLKVSIASMTATATKAAPAHGTVTFSSAQTNGAYAPAPGAACDFYFVEQTPEGIDAGKAWVAFTCDAVERSDASACEIEESYAVFEDCDDGSGG